MNDLISRQDAIRLAEQGQIQGFEWQFKKLCTLPSAEPKPILDKIRSEIGELYINLTYEENSRRGASWGLRRALEIIDKYKSKSDIEELPSAEPERKLTNKEWVDFLSKQFTVSRTSAKEMLHVMMGVKKKDNFKKQFNGGKNEKE